LSFIILSPEKKEINTMTTLHMSSSPTMQNRTDSLHMISMTSIDHEGDHDPGDDTNHYQHEALSTPPVIQHNLLPPTPDAPRGKSYQDFKQAGVPYQTDSLLSLFQYGNQTRQPLGAKPSHKKRPWSAGGVDAMLAPAAASASSSSLSDHHPTQQRRRPRMSTMEENDVAHIYERMITPEKTQRLPFLDLSDENLHDSFHLPIRLSKTGKAMF
jgi:hypothetical protein